MLYNQEVPVIEALIEVLVGVLVECKIELGLYVYLITKKTATASDSQETATVQYRSQLT